MTRTVLVVGASGLVGTAAVERFLTEGWSVIATSRRPPEIDLEIDLGDDAEGRLQHLSVDLRDRAACQETFSRPLGISHVVYCAVYEKPGLIAGWRDPEQMATNRDMLRNVLEPLAAHGSLEHLSLLQGTKAYGAHLHRIAVPARERQARDPHENFYWLQEDLVRELAEAQGWAFTILRPQLIVGPAYGVAMSMPPIIGIYAALCRAAGRPFCYPGGASAVWEAVDARVVAGALHWAATAAVAAGETYNLTNGDVFEWRNLWPALADALGVEVGPDEPLSLATYLPTQTDRWDEVVRRHGLRPLPLSELLGESHHFADSCFAFGRDRPSPPTFVSTIKIRQAGFHEYCDTEDTFRQALAKLIERKVIPGP